MFQTCEPIVPVLNASDTHIPVRPRASALSLLVIVGLLGTSVILFQSYASLSLTEASRFLVITALLSALILLRHNSWNPWQPSFILYAMLALFHVGLFIRPALDEQIPRHIARVTHDWFLTQNTVAACLVVSTGLLAFVAGALLVSPSVKNNGEPERERPLRIRLQSVGSGIVLLGVLLWFASNIKTGGWGFFLVDYLTYLDQVDTDLANWAFLLIAAGIPLVALDWKAKAALPGLWAFAAFTLVAFPMGLRGEVLMPMVAAVCVAGTQGHLSSPKKFWFGFFVMLFPITIVRQIRDVGISGVLSSPLDFGILPTFEELGYTGRVVITSVMWHEDWHEPFKLGATYIAPTLRHVQGLMGGARLLGVDDFNLMNSEIAARVGPIGGSVVAEAHHNFGIFGVLVLLAGGGFWVTRLLVRARGVLPLSFAGLLCSAYVQHIRNAFTPFIMLVLLGTLAIMMAYSWPRGKIGSTVKATAV